MKRISRVLAETFAAAARRIAACGLVRYSSGNLSWRLKGGLVALTAKGAWLGEIEANRIAVCSLKTGESLTRVPPSVEAGLHLGIYRARPDVNVVLHFQSPFATAVACSADPPPSFNLIPEVPFYVGPVGVVEYFSPGSEELARAAIAATREHDLVILRNHGAVAAGASFIEVIQRAGFFELACEVLLHARSPRPLSADGIEALRARAARERSSGAP